MPRKASERVAVRKNSVTEDAYLQRDGTWGPWKTARRFFSQSSAERGAETAGIETYGLFRHESCIAGGLRSKAG